MSVAFSACSDDGAIVVAPEDGSAPGQDGSGPPPVVGGGNDAALAPDNFVPPGCVVTSTPADDSCVIIEALGVFVSKKFGTPLPGGGSGTLAAPFASLQKGITEAKRLNKRVYACAETYDEAIKFENGVSVFGYFNCDKATWTVMQPPAATDAGAPTAGMRARIASPTSPAATASNIVTDTVIESVDIIAPDATAPSGSSIGLAAQSSSKLTISHGKVHAGVAVKGDDGVAGVQIPDSPGTRNGEAGYSPEWCHLPPGSCISGNPCVDDTCVLHHSNRTGGTNACTGGQPAGAGGKGGSGGHWTKDGSQLCGFVYVSSVLQHANAGGDLPASATTNTGGNNGEPYLSPASGQCAPSPTSGSGGGNGSSGTDGTSATAGTITPTGFDPGNGTAGTSGTPGQGGGGGGGSVPLDYTHPYYTNGQDYWGSSGSAGGAGGCAGLAGTPGKGGGASIAILLYDAPITLRACTIEASNGGAGGAGALGSDPTPPGEAGGHGGLSGEGQVGARGGEGGRSGVSGSGAGGHSIGIAVHGTPPTLVSTPDATIGTAGVGVAEISGAIKKVPASGPGVAKALHSF
jgi:hypothetical protein